MLGSLARAIFGDANEKYVKGVQPLVDKINALEPQLRALSDAELRGQTAKLKGQLAAGKTLDSILPEAFATVRETARRVLGQRHYDVQLIGGMVLHQGKITEMKTGEGKTLVATLPAYLNALSGKGVHVITVNDYLAKRDSAWMGRVYAFLGLTTGCIVHGIEDDERQAAYKADITYGTNNEFGFDYLRDNMKFRLDDLVQRPFNFAIVDEVDSILIDEARTPLIISGPAEDSSELYVKVNRIIPQLQPVDYEKDEKHRNVMLTEAGQEHIEQLLADAGMLQPGGLYGPANVDVVHHVQQALRAHTLYSRDVDYIVRNDKVIIIDEFTGRMMEGRRFGEGLHQALEAKEGVSIQRENQTLASITFQNYFRLYPKLAGMTGTAMTEAPEFGQIYNLDVIEVPTNVPVARQDHDDEVYGTMQEKYDAIIKQILQCRERGQPVLVGTVSIERSEQLSEELKRRKIPHNVLNARHHEQESAIIAQAGRPGAVTIATNMAGRGTDIQLGGNADMRIAEELGEMEAGPVREAKEAQIKAEIATAAQDVKRAGGLYVIGTERHESRRIDNQLRGRSGRQGDPGASKFFLSLEDDLLRIFGTDRMQGVMQSLGLRNGEVIKHPLITRGLLKAQEKVEARNFDIRKNLLKFDNVMNDQRRVIYDQRRELMQAEDVSDMVAAMRAEVIDNLVDPAVPENSYAEQWDVEGLKNNVYGLLGLDLPVEAWAAEDGVTATEIKERIEAACAARMKLKEDTLGADGLRQAEKAVVLQTLDMTWKEHLLALDHVRQGIGLRAMAQRDPLNEYSREAFLLFGSLMDEVRRLATSILIKTEISVPSPEEMAARARQQAALAAESHGSSNPFSDALPEGMEDRRLPTAQVMRKPAFNQDDPATWSATVQRNAPCPCGSGKKFKQCHGKM
ncbi:MAG: preprotein translocase subunit SecA [Bdellovibrionales bacterium]